MCIHSVCGIRTDVKIVIKILITRIRSADTVSMKVRALLDDDHGRQNHRVHPVGSAGIQQDRDVIMAAVILQVSVHGCICEHLPKAALIRSRQTLVITMVQKRKDALVIQISPGIHEILCDRYGCLHPGTAVQADPGVILGIEHGVHGAFPGCRRGCRRQAHTVITLVKDRRVPVDPEILRCEAPVRMRRVELLQIRAVALGEARQLFLETRSVGNAPEPLK